MAGKTIFILDNGHGGIIDGVYQTQGKRSPKWPDGSQLFEGEFNRDVVARIMRMGSGHLHTVNLVPELKDISLRERVKRANAINRVEVAKGNKVVYVSIHANGHSNSAAHGWEVFTSPGQTTSDKYATVFFNQAKAAFPGYTMRPGYGDGDPDKEAKFYVLVHTACPAVLTENFFMTNPDECAFLLTSTGRDAIAKMHVDAMLAIKHFG